MRAEPEPSSGDIAAGDTLVRLGGVLASTWLLWAATDTWYIASGFVHPLGALLAAILYALFFLYGFLTLQQKLPDRYATYIICGLAIALVVRTVVVTSILRPGIETDGLAISLSAAQATVAGQNPYAMDHIGAFSQYHLSPEFNTPKVDGSVVSTVTYPALSFLLYVVPELVHMDPRWVSVGAFILTIVVLGAMAPRQLRTLVPLVVLIDPTFIDYVLGLQDIVYVPLVAAAAYFWTDMPVLAGALLGLGCSIKQEPWLAVPLFAIGVFRSRSGDRREASIAVVRALAAAACTFFATNIPFIIEGPVAWLRGVLDPFIGENVQWGSGLVSLMLANDVQVPRWVYSALGAAVYLALAATVWRTWPKLRHATWLVPGLSLFFAPRSLENYTLYLLPVCLASWLGSLDTARAWKAAFIERCRSSRVWSALASAAAAVIVAGCGQAATSVDIARLVDSKGSGFADRMDIAVHNAGSRPLEATYLVIVDGTRQYLWKCVASCSPVGPGSTSRVTIAPTGYAAAVPAGSGTVAVVVDRRTGDEFESEAAVVPDGTLHLPNACLCAVADLAYPVPAGWRINLADVATRVVRYSQSSRLGSLSLTLVPSPLRLWKSEAISQDFIPFDHPVWLDVSKTVYYSGGTSPTQYAGVEVADQAGHRELFVWGAGARPIAYQGPGGVVVIEPAGRQRRLFVDAGAFAGAAHFAPALPWKFSLVVAAREPAPPMTVTFSGVDLSPGENVVEHPSSQQPIAAPVLPNS